MSSPRVLSLFAAIFSLVPSSSFPWIWQQHKTNKSKDQKGLTDYKKQKATEEESQHKITTVAKAKALRSKQIADAVVNSRLLNTLHFKLFKVEGHFELKL